MKFLLSIVSRIAGSGLVVAAAGPVTQQAYLKSSNSGEADAFGSTVAISGDTMVIGAPGEDSSSTGVNGSQSRESALQSGAAYVFVRSGGTWTQQAYLKASNTGAYDSFGWAVAISGDTIVVGAHQEDSAATTVNGNGSDNSASNSGAAYVFQRSGSVWTQQAYLKAANAGAADLFGSAVAVSGDTVVVGANREGSAATGINGDGANNGAFNSGAAYVFQRDGATWTQQAYLKASDSAASAEFGSAVAIDGERVVVGAPLADGYRGAAYVFSRGLVAWSQQARLTASNAAPDSRFGCSVAVGGDTIAAGARGESSGAVANPSDTSAPEAGAVYVFKASGPQWTQQAYLKASNPGAADYFGKSLSLDGDTLVAGAFGEDSAATGVDGNQASNAASAAGAAYVFSRSATEWFQTGYLKASNSEATDWFGGAVAVSGSTVVAGAARESGGARGVNGVQNGNGAPNSGAAYAFVVPPPEAPEIVVEAAGAAELIDGAGGVAFATSAAGTVTTRSFTVRNNGSGPLVLTGYALAGTDAGSFTVEAGLMPMVLLPGEAEVLLVHFQGLAAGSFGATLHLTCNDGDESPFDIGLTASAGSATGLYDAWAAAAGLAGPSAVHDATPFHDGVVNLLKYAFNLNGGASDARGLTAGSGTAGLPVFSVVGSGAQTVFRVEYLRRKGSGITYTPMVSSTLGAGGFLPMSGTITVTDLDAQWERVRLDQPRNPAVHPRGFGRVVVTLP